MMTRENIQGRSRQGDRPMKTLPKASRPTQTPSHNGHGIALGEVIATAIEVEGLTARTVIDGMPCYKNQDYKAGLFYLGPHGRPDSVRMGGYWWDILERALASFRTH